MDVYIGYVDNNQRGHTFDGWVTINLYDTIAEFNVDSKSEYTASLI